MVDGQTNCQISSTSEAVPAQTASENDAAAPSNLNGRSSTSLHVITGTSTLGQLSPSSSGFEAGIDGKSGLSPNGRPLTPKIREVDPLGRAQTLQDEDWSSRSKVAESSPVKPFYSHSSGSEHSFRSIITVSDLGFSRQPGPDETLGPEDDRHPGANTPSQLSQDQADLEGFGDDARSLYSIWGDDLESISASTVEQRLRDSYVESTSNHASPDHFLPRRRLERTLTSRIIQKVLKEVIPELAKEGRDKELRRLDEDIRGIRQDEPSSEGVSDQKSRLKLFGILLCGGKANCIRCFVNCGVDDSSLPISYSRAPSPRLPGSRKPTLHTRLDPDFKEPLKCFEKWAAREVDWFLREQYVMLAPFFDLNDKRVCLYVLPPRIIMPFIEFQEIEVGGQASVGKVRIHPDHHNFKSNHSQEESTGPYFAIKRLYSQRREDFEKEVECLERFSGENQGHHHLIRLLLTYHNKKDYHMLFRWADGNLRHFWEANPVRELHPSQERVCWLVKQFHGIADGLRAIHGSDSDAAEAPASELHPDGKNTGRHGDIKPENILWLKNYMGEQDHMVISDFGLSRFHNILSRSAEGSPPGYSPSYRPPECDLHQNISINYDIWTLGCLLLDFLTWYLEGFAAVRTFEDNRVEDERRQDSGSLSEDKFFQVRPASPSHDQGGGRREAKLKPAVLDWMERLRGLDHCPKFAHDILEIIHRGLLVPNKDQRWECAKVVRELEGVLIECRRNEAYCLAPQRWTGGRIQTLRVVTVNTSPPDPMSASFPSQTERPRSEAGQHTPASSRRPENSGTAEVDLRRPSLQHSGDLTDPEPEGDQTRDHPMKEPIGEDGLPEEPSGHVTDDDRLGDDELDDAGPPEPTPLITTSTDMVGGLLYTARLEPTPSIATGTSIAEASAATGVTNTVSTHPAATDLSRRGLGGAGTPDKPAKRIWMKCKRGLRAVFGCFGR
ncbi:kinase-like domain-containing protein [Podospora conica]|nr:kinase-like domain-containing protein [Schizothecium conicum]